MELCGAAWGAGIAGHLYRRRRRAAAGARTALSRNPAPAGLRGRGRWPGGAPGAGRDSPAGDCGFIEGYLSPSNFPAPLKFALGATLGAALVLYLSTGSGGYQNLDG